MKKGTPALKKRKKAKVHGFRARMKSATGKRVVASRKRKGRKSLTTSDR